MRQAARQPVQKPPTPGFFGILFSPPMQAGYGIGKSRIWLDGLAVIVAAIIAERDLRQWQKTGFLKGMASYVTR